ncbi:MAG: efflux RND transporter permease subunit [Bdellovibrionales bacterium]|nr:efflux RND transporter permease subunit [Bdellovibrionales bacterium]
MTLSDFSIKRPVFAWILMFGLIFFGLRSFKKMGVNENPGVDYPTITVSYSYDGATPAVIEKDILEPVESVLVSISGIRNMTSTANRGNGQIRLEFELHLNVDFALQEVQTLLGRAQRQLPDAVEPRTIRS